MGVNRFTFRPDAIQDIVDRIDAAPTPPPQAADHVGG
jgi:hypothetical protein